LVVTDRTTQIGPKPSFLARFKNDAESRTRNILADSLGVISGAVTVWKGEGLALDSALSVERHPMGRSRITNKVRSSPLGVDGRSERGRRWRDLLDGLIAAVGPGEPDKLRELATMKLSLEATQAAVINGDLLRSEDLVRLANVISKRERELRAKQRQREVERPEDLCSKLSSRYAKGGAP